MQRQQGGWSREGRGGRGPTCPSTLEGPWEGAVPSSRVAVQDDGPTGARGISPFTPHSEAGLGEVVPAPGERAICLGTRQEGGTEPCELWGCLGATGLRPSHTAEFWGDGVYSRPTALTQLFLPSSMCGAQGPTPTLTMGPH